MWNLVELNENYKTTPKGERLPIGMEEWGGGEGEVSGNAVLVNYCCGPICHIMDAKVSISVNFLSIPNRRGSEK